MKKPRSKRVAFGKGKPTEEMKKGWSDSIKVQLDDLMKQVEQYKLEKVMANIPASALGSISGTLGYASGGGANYGGTPNWQYKQNDYTPQYPNYVTPPPMQPNWSKTTIHYNSGVNFIEEPDKYLSRKFHKSNNGVHFPCE